MNSIESSVPLVRVAGFGAPESLLFSHVPPRFGPSLVLAYAVVVPKEPGHLLDAVAWVKEQRERGAIVVTVLFGRGASEHQELLRELSGVSDTMLELSDLPSEPLREALDVPARLLLDFGFLGIRGEDVCSVLERRCGSARDARLHVGSASGIQAATTAMQVALAGVEALRRTRPDASFLGYVEGGGGMSFVDVNDALEFLYRHAHADSDVLFSVFANHRLAPDEYRVKFWVLTS